MKWQFLVFAALAPIASVAHAQAGGDTVSAESAYPANVSVANRPRPEYAPIGGHVGDFFLYPQLDVLGVYSNNVRATNSGQISDVSVQVRPSVRMVSNWTRNAVQFGAFYQREIHAKYGSEDFGQYGADANGALYVGPNTQLSFGASAARLNQPRSDINSTNATRSPIGYTNVAGSATLQHSFAAFTVVGSAGYTKQNFSDGVAFDGTPVPQGYRDNSTTYESIEGRYLVGAGTSIIAHLGAQQIRYDDNPLFGFDRNSSSIRAELGVGLALTRLLYGDLRVGYFKQQNDDARFLDSSGLSFSANLLYSLTPLTSVRLTADRSVEPGGSIVTSGNVRSTVALTIEHELRRNIILSAFGRYSNVEPQGTTTFFGSAQEYEGRLGIDYYMNRRFRLSGKLSQFSRRSSTFASIDQTMVLAGIVFTL